LEGQSSIAFCTDFTPSVRLPHTTIPTKATKIRIHKSYIIQLEFLEAIVGNQVEIQKKLLPIGATYKEELLKRLSLE